MEKTAQIDSETNLTDSRRMPLQSTQHLEKMPSMHPSSLMFDKPYRPLDDWNSHEEKHYTNDHHDYAQSRK